MEAAGRIISQNACGDTKDIYCLAIEELADLISPAGEQYGSDTRDTLMRRKHEIWLESRLTAPERLSDPEQVAADAAAVQSVTGTASGRARAARTIAEAGEIEPGEILVVEEPGLAWTPFLATAAGFVAEAAMAVPGVAAVVREYGIPAVFGCPSAQKSAENAWKTEVNGDEGEVTFMG